LSIEREIKNLDGKLHCEDGPAVFHSDGTVEYYIHGQRHREDGPAIKFGNGSKVWMINGKHHREDGPAGIFVDPKGYKQIWRLNGVEWKDGPVIFSNHILKTLWLASIISKKEEDRIAFDAMMILIG